MHHERSLSQQKCACAFAGRCILFFAHCQSALHPASEYSGCRDWIPHTAPLPPKRL
jgi:hypothetical protein